MEQRIVIIEDDEMLNNMYSQKFKMAGYEVFSAFNGQDGLVLSDKEKPDLIILDIIMPKMDGFAVLKRLRKNEATKKIPVLLLTNLGQEDDVKKGRELGAQDYFIKANHTPSEIIEKVKNLLHG